MLLYSVLCIVFIMLLVLLAVYTPSISWYLLSGAGNLTFLTIEEQAHMFDVQQLFIRALFIAAGCVVMLLVYQKFRGITKDVVRDSLIMCGGLVILLLPFSWTFDAFHTLLFPQGNWQFPLDSWLITHYPPVFFVGFAAIWVGLSALMLWLLGKSSKMQS